MKSKILKFFINNWLTIFLAIIPPFLIFYYLQREVHQLEVILNNNISVVKIDRHFTEDITILYDNNRIESLNVLELIVKNTGNCPIEPEDFKQPLLFSFNGFVLYPSKLISVNPGSP